MDVVITTSDPDNVSEDTVREALESAGYFVGFITIVERTEF
jgi:hypothetical protein